MPRIAAAVMAILCCLAGCDVDVFGLDWKRLGGGWLIPPHQRFGTLVVEIGWRKPLILARADGSNGWDVIDTATRKETTISDQQRKTDPTYRDIPVCRARDAWNQLKRYRSVW
jgi:hypothetical protein